MVKKIIFVITMFGSACAEYDLNVIIDTDHHVTFGRDAGEDETDEETAEKKEGKEDE